MCLQFHVKRRPLKKINVPAISREAPALEKKKKKKKKGVSVSGVDKGRRRVKHRSQVKRLKIEGQAWSK
jgi:hypothetical protein